MDTSKLTTSTGFRYENSFAKSVEKFPTLARLATKATFGIPGLALTKVEDGPGHLRRRTLRAHHGLLQHQQIPR